MSRLNLIEEEWKQFQQQDIRAYTDETQSRQAKIAFFAGAIAVMNVVATLDKEEDVQVLTTLADVTLELAVFNAEQTKAAGGYIMPTCIDCGCTQLNPCIDVANAEVCSWESLDKTNNSGLCSRCKHKLMASEKNGA